MTEMYDGIYVAAFVLFVSVLAELHEHNAVIRIAVLHYVSLLIIRKAGLDKGSRYTYLVGSVWKNTGLAVSMCIAILADATEAAVPGIICLIAENIWFSFTVNGNRADRMAKDPAGGRT